MREYGTNVMMFGTGEYRSGDVFLCQIPTASFVSGAGTLFFAGLANGKFKPRSSLSKIGNAKEDFNLLRARFTRYRHGVPFCVSSSSWA